MNSDNMSEADFMEDGADYLEEDQCSPSYDCMKFECNHYCDRYDKWFWSK